MQSARPRRRREGRWTRRSPHGRATRSRPCRSCAGAGRWATRRVDGVRADRDAHKLEVEGRTPRADMMKHCRAAFRNSLVNLAISFAAALAWASRALARCASLFRSAVSIASSLRGTPTGEPRRRHRRVEVPPPPKLRTPKRTTRCSRSRRRGPSPAARAPPRGATAPAGTADSYCRSS